MSITVFSRNWYRVEKLTPRLKSQVDISSQQFRGERWYVLRESVSGNLHRYSAQAYALIGLMDGAHTIGEIWAVACNRLEQDLPTQDEVISLVSSLHQADMIHLNVPANAKDLFMRTEKKHQQKLLQKTLSPMSLQVPLFDPTLILDRLCPLLDKVFGYKFLVFYLLCVVSAAVLSLRNFEELSTNIVGRVLAADNLFLLWVLYPLIKVLHELGHAYVVRRFGGQVPEVGVMFLVFIPMPYVNATESASFENKYQRILVSAAGVVVELFIAAIALILWTMVEDGFFKAILFNIVVLAGVSTVLFNGNPLMKFDAYYMLADYLEIPNLAKKSVSYWAYLCKRYLFALRSAVSPAVDKRECLWLFFYNLLSFVYRVFISISIVLFVGSQYFAVGVLLAVWTFASGWFIPFVKMVVKPFGSSEFKMQRRRPGVVMAIVGAVVWGLLFELPLPYTLTSEAVVWGKGENQLYAGESGFVKEVLVANRSSTSQGSTLMVLENYDLLGRANILKAEIAEAKFRLQSVYNDRAQSRLVLEEIARLEEELVEIKDNLQQTRVVSKASGEIVIDQLESYPNRFVARGELVGYIRPVDEPLDLKLMLPEELADQVVNHLVSVSVRPASNISLEFPATLQSVVPKVSRQLLSPILSTQGGGEIIMDPSDAESSKTVENFLIVNVHVPHSVGQYIEERFFVRFKLEDEPVFMRIYRMVRRTFLEYFNV